MFDPTSPFPAIASFFLALLTAHILMRIFGSPSEAGRCVSIDGIRGYLAFFVFLHHSCIWYFYLKTKVWSVPPSNLYTNFGEVSVAFFFMITSFLFFTKIVNNRTKKIDWMKLYVSRGLRLIPLYFFVMALFFLIIAILSHGSLNESLFRLIRSSLEWLSFTIPGNPDVNRVKSSYLITAGVVWSLPYEWGFYLLLPLFALCLGESLSKRVFALGVLGIVVLATRYQALWHLLSFAGGIITAILVRFEWFCKFSQRPAISVLLIIAIGMTVSLFPSFHNFEPFLLTAMSFAFIAGGNTLFGLLSSKISLVLGEMAYSIYLLHGLMLFVLFNFGFGKQLLSPLNHWLVILVATPCLIATCFLTFQFIERPGMRQAGAVTAWIRSALRQKDKIAGKQA